jgi:hypothetical protein
MVSVLKFHNHQKNLDKKPQKWFKTSKLSYG